MSKNLKNNIEAHLFSDVKNLIEESKRHLSQTINTTLSMLYWKIGRRLQTDILHDKRAEYGKKIITNLSKQLNNLYGRGWDEKTMRHCLRSAETFSEDLIIYATQRNLGWTHLKTIMYLKDDLQRQFYIELCVQEKWSTRLLSEKIKTMLYERTAISKKPVRLIKREINKLHKDEQLSPDLVFKDPYFLNFLGLKDTYNEHDLERAILNELEQFILELGQGFTFVERQKRMLIDGEDFKLDLLFFHRKLNRLIAVELKLGQFKPSYKAQMELYLRWLDKYEKGKTEQTPLGLILCAEGNKEQIELLELHKSGIKVAEYLTELPNKKALQQKLHQAIELSKRKRFIVNRKPKK